MTSCPARRAAPRRPTNRRRPTSRRRRASSCVAGSARHRDGLRVRPRSFSTSPGSDRDDAIDFLRRSREPRLKRSEFCVRCAGRPIARSTCDGSSVPDEHADPVETATPSRSSAISRLSASTRSKLMLVVFGTRRSRSPLTAVPGTLPQDAVLEAVAQSRATRAASVVSLPASEAAPRRRGRRSPATFSVPARRLRSCLPPVRSGCSRVPRLTQSAPAPLGPPNLCAESDEQIDAERAHGHRNLADRLHGVGVHERAVLVRDRRERRDRLNRADLVVRVHHRDERRVVRDERAHALGRDDARLIDGEQ